MTQNIKEMNDEGLIPLTKVLSRLAALRGFLIPSHRFLLAQEEISKLGGKGVKSLVDLSWALGFPSGSVYTISQPIKSDLPCLWVSKESDTYWVVKGAKSDGSYACENSDGISISLTAQDCAKGFFYGVNDNDVSSEAHASGDQTPKTATEWFFYAIKKRMMQFGEGIIATSMANILALAGSFYAMQVYDRVVPAQNYHTLVVLSIGTLIAVLFELLMRQLRAVFVDKACRSIDNELSGVFFDQALSVRMDARPKSVGTFASQLKQFELVRNFLTSSTLFVMTDAPFAILFIIVIWMIGGYVALPPLLLLPISLGLGLYAKFKLGKLSEDQVRDANVKNGLLIEAVDGIESIKSIGGEWKFLDMWRKLNSETTSKELKVRNVTNFVTNCTHALQQISYVSLIGVGVYAIHSGDITMGALVACSIISNRALAPIMQLPAMIVQYQHAKAALQGLNNLMAMPRDREIGQRTIVPETSRGNIKLEGASYEYEKDLQALKPVNLNILPGEKVAILGAVGSGKSTLLKLMSGLYKPTEGKVFLDSIDMSLISPEFLREKIGYLAQEVRLFNGTLRENLTLGLASPSDEHILEIATLTFLDRVIKQHPQGLELMIAEGGKGLSGGQRQIVGLTRMLLARPTLLLLDEPTASMDPDLERAVLKNLFENLPKETTIVVSTHKSTLLNYIARVMVIDRGLVVVDGPRDTVLGELAKNRNQLNQKSNEIKKD
jgi:ATP-binding cassette, subfamily C, bacterial LapB